MLFSNSTTVLPPLFHFGIVLFRKPLSLFFFFLFFFLNQARTWNEQACSRGSGHNFAVNFTFVPLGICLPHCMRPSLPPAPPLSLSLFLYLPASLPIHTHHIQTRMLARVRAHIHAQIYTPQRIHISSIHSLTPLLSANVCIVVFSDFCLFVCLVSVWFGFPFSFLAKYLTAAQCNKGYHIMTCIDKHGKPQHLCTQAHTHARTPSLSSSFLPSLCLSLSRNKNQKTNKHYNKNQPKTERGRESTIQDQEERN